MTNGIYSLNQKNKSEISEIISSVENLITDDISYIQHQALTVALKALKASVESDILECDGYLESAIRTAQKSIATTDKKWADPWYTTQTIKADFAAMLRSQDEANSTWHAIHQKRA